MASCTATEVVTYSASIVDNATIDFFFLHEEITHPLSKKVYAEVDLRSSRSSAKFLPVYPWSRKSDLP